MPCRAASRSPKSREKADLVRVSQSTASLCITRVDSYRVWSGHGLGRQEHLFSAAESAWPCTAFPPAVRVRVRLKKGPGRVRVRVRFRVSPAEYQKVENISKTGSISAHPHGPACLLTRPLRRYPTQAANRPKAALRRHDPNPRPSTHKRDYLVAGPDRSLIEQCLGGDPGRAFGAVLKHVGDHLKARTRDSRVWGEGTLSGLVS